MRKAIDTAPKNGDFVFLEDAARGTVVFARWSAETARWLDEDGTPSQLNATHWHSLQNLDEEGTPSQLNATYWHPLTPAQSVVESVDKPGSLTGPSKRRAGFAFRDWRHDYPTAVGCKAREIRERLGPVCEFCRARLRRDPVGIYGCR